MVEKRKIHNIQRRNNYLRDFKHKIELRDQLEKEVDTIILHFNHDEVLSWACAKFLQHQLPLFKNYTLPMFSYGSYYCNPHGFPK